MLQENWITVNGLKIRYFESGFKNPRCVLFIHGLGSSSDRWLDIPETLSSNFHTIALDLPGFGKSDKPKTNYTIQFFQEFVQNFMAALGINNGTSLVGHSLGGFIATEIVLNNTDRIDHLVLIDSSGFLNRPTPILEDYLDAAMNPDIKKVRQTFEKMVAVPSRIPDRLVESFIERINFPNAKIAFASTLKNSTNSQISIKKLQKMSVPTLIVWGVHDDVIPLDHLQIFHQNIMNSKIEIIDDAGHAPFAEKPDQILKLLHQFLK